MRRLIKMKNIKIMMSAALISVFSLANCLASEDKTIKNIDARKALTEAKLAIEKTLQFPEANKVFIYKYSADSLVSEIDKLLGPEHKSTATTVPMVSTHKEAKTITHHTTPIAKPSTLEERYAKLEETVPWFKDLEIAQALNISQVITFAHPRMVKDFIGDYFTLAQDRTNTNRIDEVLLKKLEDTAGKNDVSNYNFDKSAASHVLPLIHSLGITLQDLQKNKDLIEDLNKIYGIKFNVGNASQLENDVKRKFEHYKKEGAYK